MIKSPEIIFIIGRSRSGTTLLRTMLDMHSLISIPNECTFILQLSEKYKKVKSWTPEKIENFIRDLKKTWLFENLKLDIDFLKINLLNLGKETNFQEICKQVILNSPLAGSKPDLKYVGDKNPSSSLNLKTIYSIFGKNCKYIYINRDYRDQYLSQINARIEIPNIVVSAKRWVKAFTDFLKVSENKDSMFYNLRYEDLVTEPEKKLIEICGFLNISYDNKMLEFYNIENINKSFSEISLQGIHSSIKNPVSKNSIGLWKNNLAERQIKILDKICGKYKEQSSYNANTKINSFGFFIITLPGYLLYHFTVLSSCFIKWLPFNIYIKLSEGAFLGSLWNRLLRKK